MNGKTLHVTSGLSNAGMVRYALHNMKISEEYCPIDLSCGYLPKDFSDKELCLAVASQSFVVTTQERIELFDELKSSSQPIILFMIKSLYGTAGRPKI